MTMEVTMEQWKRRCKIYRENTIKDLIILRLRAEMKSLREGQRRSADQTFQWLLGVICALTLTGLYDSRAYKIVANVIDRFPYIRRGLKKC